MLLCMVLYDSGGKLVVILVEIDFVLVVNFGEMFIFKFNDGKFDIYGLLCKFRDFDLAKKYFIINLLYGGFGSSEFGMFYVSSLCAENNCGYLVMKVKNRGIGGCGKGFLGVAYGCFGDIDIQDYADGIRHLCKWFYVDGIRVGIVGGSYGGYMSVMGVLKYFDVYICVVNCFGVIDWCYYDIIYTECYMSMFQFNSFGYDIGRVIKDEYIVGFKEYDCHILIMYGMVDDNVYSTNAFQLINVLDKVGVEYESWFFFNSGYGLG